MPNESSRKTIVVALGVCLVCSVLVSTAAVMLRGIQKENQRREKIRNILIAGDLFTEKSRIADVYREKVRPEIIDIREGRPVNEEMLDEFIHPDRFDIEYVARNPETSLAVPVKRDLAQLRRIPRYMVIYRVLENGEFTKFILPIYGRGLWSTMYGFMALDRDLRTIRGFTFYEHGETPGLGGEVDNPRWKKIWVGKQAYDVEGHVRIEVIKGNVDRTRPGAIYQVDGLSGSTLTTRGVDRMVKFWLGDDGYGPYIRYLRGEG